MPVSMYDVSVGIFTRMLTAMTDVLDRSAEHAVAKRIDPNALLTARLFPDMFPLMRQVQSATDHAKGATGRLAGMEVPRFEDTETSFDDLKARIARTLSFVGGADRAAIDQSADRDISWMQGGKERTMKGRDYLLNHAMPNFYFHLTTAYGILRHNGVEIGKRHFLGN